MKILIVEDDPVCARLLSLMLADFGDCEHAADGQHAIDAVRTAFHDGHAYDLICLDIMMPNVDGHEALREIREVERENGFNIGQGAKIVMTTALSDHKNVMQSFKGECDGYLVKPTKKSDVVAKLKELELIG